MGRCLRVSVPAPWVWPRSYAVERVAMSDRARHTRAMSDRTAQPLVEQLRFTRAEFRRGLRGTPEADGVRRLEPMNSIGWIVAHMAWHEQRYWLTRGSGETPRPELNE